SRDWSSDVCSSDLGRRPARHIARAPAAGERFGRRGGPAVGCPAMPLIAVLDYGIGNLHSAQKALQHLGADARLTADPAVVRDAAGVVLPGVGNFGRCMEALEAAGLDEDR